MASISLVVSRGNIKLGACDIINRAVGDTCSPTCPYLTGVGIPEHAKCYALNIEQRFTACRLAGQLNAAPRVAELRWALEACAARKRAFRFHERGDFGNGKPHAIDGRYVLAIERALDTAAAIPPMWAYTHIYHSRLAGLSARGVAIYASVHNAEHMAHAKRVGFRRFALVLPVRVAGKCKPQIKSMPEHNGSAHVEALGERWPICPAQRVKTMTCEKCQLCIRGTKRIGFLTH